MGRNKYSEKEIKEIGKLLRLKNAANRFGQKQIRHQLRVDYEFNIADFNEPGQAFGEDDLLRAVERGAIVILDDATRKSGRETKREMKPSGPRWLLRQAKKPLGRMP